MTIPKKKQNKTKKNKVAKECFLRKKQLQTQWSKRLEVMSEIQATLCRIMPLIRYSTKLVKTAKKPKRGQI